MMRLIDADALQDVLYHEAFETDSDMQRWDSGCWIRYKMFENAIDNAPTIEPKWIPVSKRLPEAEYGESDSVLATCKHKDEDKPRWIRLLYFNGGNWCYPTGEAYTSEVIAWMPLPEPWKGADNDY